MRGLLPLALAACLLLCGCASLLERSYSTVEPYTNRYWDSSAEDTLRAESYQDLVNSLLMLVEQQAEEGTIRCYEEANSYIQAQRARAEVRRETMLGSYLLEKLDFTYQYSASYSTLTYQMTYREDAEALASIMKISDSQSLVDLLRLAVREEHEKLTARFVYDTPRTEVTDAVEGLWSFAWARRTRRGIPRISQTQGRRRSSRRMSPPQRGRTSSRSCRRRRRTRLWACWLRSLWRRRCPTVPGPYASTRIRIRRR